MPVYFTPPTVRERRTGRHPLWSRTYLDVGVTVLKENGFYRQVRIPSDAECEAADAYYQGGRSHLVDNDEAADLIAAGYGAFLHDFTGGIFDPAGYGEGVYGTGTYGA